jgi:signal transduction histidine kinase
MPAYGEKEIMTIVMVGSFVTLLLVAFLISFIYFYQRRHFQFLREKEAIRSQYQEELLRTQLEIQEATFRTISEEIHDNIGQTLSFVKLSLNTMTPVLTAAQENKWQESKELLTKVIQDLRSLSRTLNTDFIREIGLTGAIRQQLSLLERTALYQLTFEVAGDKRSLPVSQELVLYRVIQELLNNIVKHAEARSIRITMQYDADHLAISVEDNGKGFNPEELQPKDGVGIGLRNIRNRISMIHGTVSIQSIKDQGTTVCIQLPKTEET